MNRGFLLHQLKVGGAIGIFLLFLFGAGISGCASVPTQAASSKPKPCKPLDHNANIYNVASLALTTNSAVSTGTTIPVTGISLDPAFSLWRGTLPQNLSAANLSDPNFVYKALVNETKLWSETQTILLNESNKVQIVITFLSPPLIQAIYNTEALIHGPAVVSLQTELAEIAKRDELIFFISVITNANGTASPNSAIVELPVHSMIIINSDDLAVSPLHDDHNLGQPINISLEPVSGYVSYPIGVKNGETCAWVLNPDYNTKIIITTPSIFVNKEDKGTYTWVIPYAPFIEVSGYSPLPPDMVVDFDLVKNSEMPNGLMHDLLAPEGWEENIFWQIYAGFLWKQVVRGSY